MIPPLGVVRVRPRERPASLQAAPALRSGGDEIPERVGLHVIRCGAHGESAHAPFRPAAASLVVVRVGCDRVVETPRGAGDVPVRVVVLPVEESEQVAARLDESRRHGRLALYLDRRKQAFRDGLCLLARKMLLDERERRFGEAPEVVARGCDYLGCLLDALLSVASVPYRNP